MIIVLSYRFFFEILFPLFFTSWIFLWDFFLGILFPLLQLMEVWDGEWGGGQEEVLNVRPVLHTRNTFCKTLKYFLQITRNTFCRTLYSLEEKKNIYKGIKEPLFKEHRNAIITMQDKIVITFRIYDFARQHKIHHWKSTKKYHANTKPISTDILAEILNLRQEMLLFSCLLNEKNKQ